jgi:hypothetical protein
LELAAKIYAYEKLEGVQFRILNKDKSLLLAEEQANKKVIGSDGNDMTEVVGLT